VVSGFFELPSLFKSKAWTQGNNLLDFFQKKMKLFEAKSYYQVLSKLVRSPFSLKEYLKS